MTTTSDELSLRERVAPVGSSAPVGVSVGTKLEASVAAGPSLASSPLSRFRSRLIGRLTSLPACVAILFGLALALRLIEIRRAYDIFIDEVTYARIATNLAHGAGLTLYGQPFNLHPPAVFALLASIIWTFGWHGGVQQTLFQLRDVNAICGALVPVAVFLVLDRAVSRRVAMAVGLVLTVDPFALLYDSRVMLEAPAQMAVAGMFACLAAAVCAASHRTRTWLIWAAGLAGAVAVTSKETFGMVVVVSLAVLLVTGWVLERRQILTVLGTTAAGYCLSVLGVALSTGIGAWWNAKYDDVMRLVGVRQETGFNASTTHVTLLSRAFSNASQFAITYAALALGTVAAVALLLQLRPWRNHRRFSSTERVVTLLALWTVVAGAYLGYATLFGSIEEQMYYILLAPSVASLAAWLARAGGTAADRRQRRWRRIAIGILTVMVAFDSFVWVSVHSRQDDEYRQMLAWESVNVPAGSVISVTDSTGQFLITNAVLGQWNTIPELIAHHVQYVLLSTSLVEQGYGLGSEAFMQTLDQKARVVFQANGPSDGSLRLYDVTAITGAAQP
jgi:hypothetical protein